jgi:GGDEF domain-containing protein
MAGDPLQTLHSVVHTYLTTLLAVSDAVGDACPAIGQPHQQRLARLRTRLSFDSNKTSIEASTRVVRNELRYFAEKSAAYVNAHTQEWKSASQQIQSSAAALVRRQNYYGARFQEAARLLAETAAIEDPQQRLELARHQAAALANFAESMMTESQSLLMQITELRRNTETRLAEVETVDRATGVMNRNEMERRIEAQRASGGKIVRLLFRAEWDGPADSWQAVLREVGNRLTAEFRPEDLVARWGETEFLVLFDGSAEIAERRGEMIAGHLTGPYASANRESIHVTTHVELLDRRVSSEVAG